MHNLSCVKHPALSLISLRSTIHSGHPERVHRYTTVSIACPTSIHQPRRRLFPRSSTIRLSSSIQRRTFAMSSSSKSQEPTIDKIEQLDASEAKWSKLQKINWTDQTGKKRVWEACSRSTRGSSGVDAVAIVPILLHPSRPAATVLITQYRPPVQSYCVEFPAGLVDDGETVEQAALRELKEETGYEGKVLSLSPIVVADPGLTTANMQLAIVEVRLGENDPLPEQKLDSGEFIERHVVPLKDAHSTLLEWSKKDNYIVDARLFHFIAGIGFTMGRGKEYGLL